MDEKEVKEISNEEVKSTESNNEIAVNPFNPKKIRHYIFLVAIILAIVLIVVFSQNDFNKIWEQIQKADFSFIGLGLLMMLLYWTLTSLSLHILIKKKGGKKLKFIDSMAIANSSFFFNGITPFSTGGQPFQVYSYHKCGISPSKSTGVLTMNFIIYQIALNLISILAISFFGKELSQAVNGFLILVFIGFTINILVLVGLILIAISKRFRRICIFFVKKICKLRILKKKSFEIQYRASRFIVDFQINFKSLFKDIGVLFITLVLQFLALAIYFSIPFFIFKAVHIDLTFMDVFSIMAMGAFALSFMIWIPTPGSSGGAEFAFTSLFPVVIAAALGGDVINSSSLLWRFLTYYCGLLFGFINFFIFEKRHKQKEE